MILTRRQEAALPLGGRLSTFFVMGLLALLVVELAMGFLPGSQLSRALGHDWQTYQDAALRFLSGQGFYSDYQLAGPYPVVQREVMYPPVVLALLVPFALLPSVLWFAVPIGITAWIVWTQKPLTWAWVAILALLTLPIHYSTSYSLETLVNGSPTNWIMAFVALATRYPVFGPLALLKPTPAILPFALVGIRAEKNPDSLGDVNASRRGDFSLSRFLRYRTRYPPPVTGRIAAIIPNRQWLLGLALLGLASLAFLPLWFDWIKVMTNARTEFAPWTYAVMNAELMLIPLIPSLLRRLSGTS